MGVRMLLLWPLCMVTLGSAATAAFAFTTSADPAGRAAAEGAFGQAPSPSAVPSTVGTEEAQSVYCLGRAQWPKLADAIIALRMADGISPPPSNAPSPAPDRIVI